MAMLLVLLSLLLLTFVTSTVDVVATIQYEENHPIGKSIPSKSLRQRHHRNLASGVATNVKAKMKKDPNLDIQNFPANINTNNIDSVPLYQYLVLIKEYKLLDHMILLYWDKNGKLISSSPILSHPRWISNELLMSVTNQTSTSPYGKVALLFNSDTLKMIDDPDLPYAPIPLLMYSKAYEKDDDNNMILVPTAYELNGNIEDSVEQIRTFVGSNEFMVSYDVYMERQPIIVWRGDIHGNAEPERRAAVAMSEEQNEKKSVPIWLDVTRSTRLGTTYTPKFMITNFRYHMDLGGVSGTSWGGLRWKMCAGALVFKVDTWSQDLWHTTIIPWEHYIPVRSDLKDLRANYEWAENHPDEAYRIAAAGQQKCLETYTTHYNQQKMIQIIQDLPDASEQIIKETITIFQQHIDLFTLSKSSDMRNKST